MAAVATRVKTVYPVLVVSPNTFDRSSLHGILQEDCELHAAADIREALSVARMVRPRVVICDQILADGDWRDLLANFGGGERETPVIVVSTFADDRLWAEVLNLGGYDLLAKPFTACEVSRVVKMAARRSMTAGG